jgi:hypothetical protein
LFYGVAESLFGLASIYFGYSLAIADQTSNGGLKAYFVVLAGLYVVVRGCDNFEQGIAQAAELLQPYQVDVREVDIPDLEFPEWPPPRMPSDPSQFDWC